MVASALGLILTLVVVTGCRGVVSPGDDDDEKFDVDAAGAIESDLANPPPATATPVPTMTPVPTVTPTPTATSTPTPTPTITPTPSPTSTPTPTPTPTPVLFPPEQVRVSVRAEVGASGTGILAVDSDGSIVDGRVLDGPDGFVVEDNGTYRWDPIEPGTWTATFEITDDDGLVEAGEVAVTSRYEYRADALVSMGDSVASGHGLELLDYLEFDPCWRDESEAYPRQLFERLVDGRILNAERAEFAFVACSGYDVDDLFEREVTATGQFDADPSTTRTQLEWAVLANARFVTITIGANDTGFVGPGQLFLDDATLDLEQIDRRLAVIDQDLRIVLDRLVDATDSTIYVTNYYDPTAENPQGVPGCRTECFAEAASFVVGGMNDAIASAAASYGDRVRLVRLDQLFIGHSAPNGLGPDGFREAGFGQIGDALNILVAEIHPYCARGETTGDPWVNAIDCVHPDRTGTGEIARAVAAAIIADQ